jgi:hypothetical protein
MNKILNRSIELAIFVIPLTVIGLYIQKNYLNNNIPSPKHFKNYLNRFRKVSPSEDEKNISVDITEIETKAKESNSPDLAMFELMDSADKIN